MQLKTFTLKTQLFYYAAKEEVIFWSLNQQINVHEEHEVF